MRNLVLGIFTAAALTWAGGAAAQAIESPLEARAAGADALDAAGLVELGDLYVEAMQLDEARRLYREALKLEKKYGEAEFGLARIDMARGKLEKSKRACRGVWRRHKSESVGDVCSGWVWLTFDRSARALDEFKKALDKGDTARGQLGMAEAYRRRVAYDDAVAAYRAALDAGAGYRAHLGLGLALEGKRDREGAVAALRRAVEAEPASCEARYHLGRVLGEGPEAVTQLRTALAIRPDWADAHQALGDALLEAGDFAGAERAFEDALAAEADRGTAHLGLGKALYGQEKTTEAREHLERAIEMVPNLVDAYLLIADIDYASGDSDAALEALDKAKSMAPGVVKVYLHTGETYFRLGRYTSANSHLKQAVSMKPDLSLAHVILGDIACERRLYDRGQQHFADALAGDMQGVSAADIQKRQAQCKPKHP